MTIDQAVALSLLPELPRRELTARLKASDPELLENASSLLARAREIRDDAARKGIHVIAWNDPHVPAPLLAIDSCPPALWYRGSLDCLAVPAVAIVGSRAASPVAVETAARLAQDLASRGITIVSGLARGVDSAAHRGALRTGHTIAVLGSGIDHIYPAEHRDLAGEVARSGLLLSEFPPGTTPLPFRFPMRNRLISGLSRAVIVIEASDRSGSLITAGCALDQGREVMAVPGNVLSGRNRGGHALIRDGAKIVECAEDVIEELGLEWPSQGKTTAPAGCAAATSGDAAAVSSDPVLHRMRVDHPYDFDELARVSGLNAQRLLPHLAELELRGLIRRVDGGRFLRSAMSDTRTC